MKIVMISGVKVYILYSLWERVRGVIGREKVLDEGVVLILNCNWVHSFLLKRPLALAFLDNQYRLIKEYDVKPNRFSELVLGASHTLEYAVTMKKEILNSILPRIKEEIIRELIST